MKNKTNQMINNLVEKTQLDEIKVRQENRALFLVVFAAIWVSALYCFAVLG